MTDPILVARTLGRTPRVRLFVNPDGSTFLAVNPDVWDHYQPRLKQVVQIESGVPFLYRYFDEVITLELVNASHPAFTELEKGFNESDPLIPFIRSATTSVLQMKLFNIWAHRVGVPFGNL
jgi:hypothetical protein